MNTAILKTITYILAFASLIFFTSVQAQVLWYGDPDEALNNVFYRFDTQISGSQSNCSPLSSSVPTASTVNDSEYGKVWKINKQSNRKRAEFARTIPANASEGETYYYGWRWKVMSTSQINGEVTVWQWKSASDSGSQPIEQNYPLNMEYDGTHLTLNAYGTYDLGGFQKSRSTVIWEKAINPGQWMSFVIKMKLERGNSISGGGYVEFWYNGVKQSLGNGNAPGVSNRLYSVKYNGSDNTRAYHRTMDGTVVYPKWGSYNQESCKHNITTYYDEMRIGRTLESVLDPLRDESLSGEYYFKNVATGRYLQVSGTSLLTNADTNGASREWQLVPKSDGYFNIDSLVSSRGVLDTDGNKGVICNSLQPSGSNAGADDKVWLPEHVSGNIYRFANKADNRGYLAEVVGSSTIEHTSWNGNRAQWELVRISD